MGDLLAEAIDRSWPWRSSVSRPRGCKWLFPARRQRPKTSEVGEDRSCAVSNTRGLQEEAFARWSTPNFPRQITVVFPNSRSQWRGYYWHHTEFSCNALRSDPAIGDVGRIQCQDQL